MRGQMAGQGETFSAHFLSALPEAQKCVKPIRFANPDLDLEKSLHLSFSHRSPTIVADDPRSHRGESAPILGFLSSLINCWSILGEIIPIHELAIFLE